MQDAQWLQWIVLAIIQGLTEYLPVSSSAHLILVSQVLNWKDQGLVMDIAAHGGSLLAVLWYFKKELQQFFIGKNWPLFYQLTLASIPLALCGFLFAEDIENHLRSPMVIAIASIVFGVLLYASDIWQKKQQHTENKQEPLSLKNALVIGLGQVCALIPGASRSGVTMTAAMSQGFNRRIAARFSFLLAIPALLMSTAYGALKLYQEPQDYVMSGVVTVALLSFLASMFSITLFLRWIEKISIGVFLYYRLILGLLILWYMT